MPTIEQLQAQIDKVKKAQTALADKVGEANQTQKELKLRLWDETVPILRTAVENLLKTAKIDFAELKELWFGKAMAVVFGPNWLEDINTVRG